MAAPQPAFFLFLSIWITEPSSQSDEYREREERGNGRREIGGVRELASVKKEGGMGG